MRISCIGKIKPGIPPDNEVIEATEVTEETLPLDPLIPVAEEVKSTLGLGGNPTPDIIIEERVGFVNTPISNGYFRTAFDPAYASALQWIKDNGGAETVDLISIEWEGQEMFQTGIDAEGNPEYLGLIGSLPMKQIGEVQP